MTETEIQKFKLGKYKIDEKLSTFNQIKLFKLESLLQDLIQERDKIKKAISEFNEGKFNDRLE